MSAELLRAIAHALAITDWQDNLTKEEMPPEWMWPFDSELKIWFDRISQERAAKYGSSGDEPEEPMMQNELAAGRGR